MHPFGRIYIARSAVFDENSFPYQSIFTQSENKTSSLAIQSHDTHFLTLSLSPQSGSTYVPLQFVPLHSGLSTTNSANSSPECFEHHTDIPPIIFVPFVSSFYESLSSTSICPFPPDVSTVSKISEVSSIPPTPTSLPSLHPMQTRSKSGIFKPKVFAATVNTEPEFVLVALTIPHWKKAMEDEFHALIHNHTKGLVPNTDVPRVFQCKWVFRTKSKEDGSLDKYKARLVAKGFQQTVGIDFSETFSPVVKAPTVRIVFTLAVSKGWDIQQIDINNSFLNGELQEDVYMSQLEGFVDPTRPSYVCKLWKALYGLKQAPRAWLDKLRTTLLNWGFKNSIYDTSLFCTHKDGRMLLLLI